MYKHRVVQGLADIINQFGGGGDDLMMKAIWMGIRGQVPLILQQLDNAPDAVALIEAKMREVLDIPPVSAKEIKAVSELPIPGKDKVALVKVEPKKCLRCGNLVEEGVDSDICGTCADDLRAEEPTTEPQPPSSEPPMSEVHQELPKPKKVTKRKKRAKRSN